MIRRHKVLLDTITAGAGDWVRLDSRYEVDSLRAFQIDMNASDTIEIEGTTLDEQDATALAAVIVDPEDITTLKSYTGNTSENDVIVGNWTFIRANKTGTNGIAKVQGHV
ncbi:unnamed protein product [marine sediment metagenome]|uniref:Uncharacterized protein n=1 Tax=marine sediment metagenome TaxID=412755 RepID=X1A9W3_9ZZZZ